jgi:hypothetical protein
LESCGPCRILAQKSGSVGIKCRGVGFRRLLRDRPLLTLRACIVNRDIKMSEPLYRLIHQTPHIVFLANVSVNELGFGSEFAQFGFQGEALLFAATRDDDPGAFPPKAMAVARPMPVRAPVMRTTGF